LVNRSRKRTQQKACGGVGGGGGGVLFGGGGGNGWASLCPTIPTNVGKISRLVELQLRSFLSIPLIKRKG